MADTRPTQPVSVAALVNFASALCNSVEDGEREMVPVPPPSATLRLWYELSAMVARARQQDKWDLLLDGHAQDLMAAEQVLRDTKDEAHGR